MDSYGWNVEIPFRFVVQGELKVRCEIVEAVEEVCYVGSVYPVCYQNVVHVSKVA
jgi:hypothetical protein